MIGAALTPDPRYLEFLRTVVPGSAHNASQLFRRSTTNNKNKQQQHHNKKQKKQQKKPQNEKNTQQNQKNKQQKNPQQKEQLLRVAWLHRGGLFQIRLGLLRLLLS